MNSTSSSQTGSRKLIPLLCKQWSRPAGRSKQGLGEVETCKNRQISYQCIIFSFRILYPTLVLDYKGEDSETKFLFAPSFL